MTGPSNKRRQNQKIFNLSILVKLFLTDIWLMFRVFWSIILNCPVLIKYAFVSLITFTMCPLWNTNHGHDSSSAASPHTPAIFCECSICILWVFWGIEKLLNVCRSLMCVLMQGTLNVGSWNIFEYLVCTDTLMLPASDKSLLCKYPLDWQLCVRSVCSVILGPLHNN